MKFKTALASLAGLLLILVCTGLFTTGVFASNASFCWKDSYGRGVGKPLTSCPSNMEKNGALCYPKCKPGYKGVGPVCWQGGCPSGFRDDGAFCAKPKAYGRGAGYPWKFGDGLNDSGMRKRCEKRHGRGKCEKHGAIFYPKCRSGFKAVGCCVCSPRCKRGQRDIGVSCAKKSYGRGVGKPLRCARGLEQNGALCYRKCKPKFNGVGPVCWGQPPRGWVHCGMGAAKTSKDCATTVVGQVTSVGEVAVTVASLGSSMGATSAAKGASKAAKIAKLRKQFAKLKAAYNKNKKAIKKFKKAADTAGKGMTVYTIMSEFEAMNGNTARPEDIARISAEMASLFDPTGVSSVVAAYSYPKCSNLNR